MVNDSLNVLIFSFKADRRSNRKSLDRQLLNHTINETKILGGDRIIGLAKVVVELTVVGVTFSHRFRRDASGFQNFG